MTRFNVLILMRSSPIVSFDEENLENPHSEKNKPNRIGHPARLVSTFKTDLIAILKKLNKEIIVKFEILCRNKLIDCF